MRRLPLILALAGLLGGCLAHEVVDPTPFEVYVAEPTGELPRYLIQPGDELEVRFFDLPEQNVVLPVRPDGYVSLPLANEVKAAGLTPEELRVELQTRYERELRDPELSVIVRTFQAYKVHVGGEVGEPGVFELGSRRTVLQSIFEAGGALPTADLSNVVVLRQTGPSSVAVIPLDLKKVLTGEDVTQDLPLWPRDAIYVPRSAIANLNLWVEQYVRNNLPFDVGWRLEI